MEPGAIIATSLAKLAWEKQRYYEILYWQTSGGVQVWESLTRTVILSKDC